MWLSLVSLLLCVCPRISRAAGPILETRSGLVEGRVETPAIGHPRIEAFRGVPFARPPTGPLRWRAPQQEKPWTGTRPGHAFGPACMQPPNSFTRLGRVPISEDCLYLNAYRPHSLPKGTGPLPVMIFFYGGSYMLGSSSFFVYDASRWVARAASTEDAVIIVTANYRLNVFGYLGHDSMRDADGSTGNYGLQDQRAAMQWVADNAAAMGGDPQRVTIFGESAGGGSVSMHLVAHRSSTLFHRAIAQSGPLGARWTFTPLAAAEEVFHDFALNAGCANRTAATADTAADGVVACLRRANASALQAAVKGPRQPQSRGQLVTLGPTIDGVEFPANSTPLRIAAAGGAARVPVLLGSNRDEGSTLIDLAKSASAEEYEQWVRATLDEEYPNGGARFGPTVLSLYPAAAFETPFAAASRVFTDWQMACPAREAARTLAGQEGQRPPVFLYQFVHVTAAARVADRTLGVFHGSELIYLFDKQLALWAPAERQLAQTFEGLWTSFAAQGRPDAARLGSGEWPPYTNATDHNLRIDSDELRVDSGLKQPFCDAWRKISQGAPDAATED